MQGRWFYILQAPGDVDKTAPTDGDALVWDGTQKLWVANIAGNFQGSLSDPPISPETGWTYIDTDDNGLYIYNGTSWILLMTLTAAGAYVLKAGDTMTGELNIFPAVGATALRVDGDIIIKTGNRLYFDGT